ncbi:MAG: recombinase family protein [Armatimonadota bacterium]
MLEKAAQGIYPSFAPIGYINVECNGRRYIQPDPNIAPTIKKLYEWYATGSYSLKTVTDRIHEEGLSFRKSGAKVPKSHIHQILTNRIYYGDFDWDGQTYHGIHEPIVLRELWEKVQDVLHENGNRRIHQQKHEWAFQGLVSCGHCGCALVAEKKNGRYVYYHCTGHKGKCPEKYVREEELTEQFGEALKAIKLDGDVLEWVISALKSSHEDEKRYHNEIIASLQRDYARLQHRLDQMYVDKLDGKISQEFYDQKSAEWRNEQSEIRRKMEKHENANYSYMDEGIKILELANRAWELYEKQEMTEKRRLLDFVFSNSTWAGGKLTPNYKKPFDLISEAVKMQAEEEERTGKKFDKTAQNENWLTTFSFLEIDGTFLSAKSAHRFAFPRTRIGHYLVSKIASLYFCDRRPVDQLRSIIIVQLRVISMSMRFPADLSSRHA